MFLYDDVENVKNTLLDSFRPHRGNVFLYERWYGKKWAVDHPFPSP